MNLKINFLLVIIYFITGCKGDKNVEFDYEKKYGDVREIRTTIYNGDIIKEENILKVYIERFDVSGKIVKSLIYDYDYLRDNSDNLKWEDNGRFLVLRKKLRLNSNTIFKYDSKLGLTKRESYDKNGRILVVVEFKKINDTTISGVLYGKNREIQGWSNIVINGDREIVSESFYSKDSVIEVQGLYYRLKNKLKNRIDIVRKDTINTIFKYLSFDKSGNYIKRKDNGNIVVRDIIYYQ